LAEEIKRVVTDLLRNEAKDPRIGKLISIISVDVSKDLRYAKIFVSVYGSPEEQLNTMEGLRQASGFIRGEIGRRIRLRCVPEISFAIDTSIEHGMKITELLREVGEKDGADGK
jgi:ribosome-binding factor A